jgi:hypothetical protein
MTPQDSPSSASSIEPSSDVFDDGAIRFRALIEKKFALRIPEEQQCHKDNHELHDQGARPRAVVAMPPQSDMQPDQLVHELRKHDREYQKLTICGKKWIKFMWITTSILGSAVLGAYTGYAFAKFPVNIYICYFHSRSSKD